MGTHPLLSSDPHLNERLSQLLGRRVSLLDVPPEGASLDQYWPAVQERAYQDVVNELVLPSGGFFDSCPIHAVSTATLDAETDKKRLTGPGARAAKQTQAPRMTKDVLGRNVR
jgi:hypothetical protein